MRLISSLIIFAQKMTGGLRGAILLSALVLLLCWYSPPWQWFIWSKYDLELGILRVVAYATMATSFLYNAVDDTVRGQRTDVVWWSLSFLFVFSIGTLSLDLTSLAAWIDTRSALTIPALIAASVAMWQTLQRIIDKRNIREADDEHNPA